MNKKKIAFSIAEAMITLLIVSIAAAVAAPVFTRRNQVTNGNGSHWMVTRNGNDISRVRGKIGIGVPTNTNPTAMLDIRNNAHDFIILKKNAAEIFKIDRNGLITINIPSATTANALSIRQNGTERALIDSAGNAKFSNTSLYRADGRAILQGGLDARSISSELTANGVLTLSPVNAAAENRRAITIRRGNTDAMWFNTEGDLRIFRTTAGAAIQLGSDASHINTTINSNGSIILNNPNAETAGAIRIQQNGTETARVNSDGAISIRKQTAGSRALRIYDAGNETAWLSSDGVLTIKKQVAGSRAIRILDANNNETAWLTSDGNSNFGVPRGAVMFFNLASCPTGWLPLTTVVPNSQGAFLRNIGGLATTKATVQQTALPNIKGWFGLYGSTPDGVLFKTSTRPNNVEHIKDGHHTTGSMTFNAGIYSNIYQDGIAEARPKNVAFLVCVKN